MPEAGRRGVVAGLDPGSPLDGVELRHRLAGQEVRILEASATEVQPQHRMADRPVPAAMDVQPLEQRLVALEQLLQGVQEEALAEAARAGEEIMLAFLGEPCGVGGLVDVVAAFLADLAEGLDADGQLASGAHEGCLPHRRCPGVNRGRRLWGPAGRPATAQSASRVRGTLPRPMQRAFGIRG